MFGLPPFLQQWRALLKNYIASGVFGLKRGYPNGRMSNMEVYGLYAKELDRPSNSSWWKA
jgi:hypothetical protein